MRTILGSVYYDVKELADLFGLSVLTIRNYFLTAKIPAKKIGKSWYATETDIKAFLDDKNTKKES